MRWNFFLKFFEGAINIEKTYKSCDKAIGALQSYNKNPDAYDSKKKAQMNDIVREGEEAAKKLLEYEGQKNWPGVFREMHKNLANMYIQMERDDEARERCEKLTEYGEVGRLDAEEMSQKLEDKVGGKEGVTVEEAPMLA